MKTKGQGSKNKSNFWYLLQHYNSFTLIKKSFRLLLKRAEGREGGSRARRLEGNRSTRYVCYKTDAALIWATSAYFRKVCWTNTACRI